MRSNIAIVAVPVFVGESRDSQLLFAKMTRQVCGLLNIPSDRFVLRNQVQIAARSCVASVTLHLVKQITVEFVESGKIAYKYACTVPKHPSNY